MAELIKVNAPVRKPLFEGVQGENEARSIQFDITPWVDELGDGVVTATAKRSQDSQPYPVTVTKVGNIVTWKPTSTDTAFAGVGSFQLEYTVDSVLAKTCIWSTMVAPSLDPAGDPPDPYDNWLADLREIEASAIQAAQDAETAVSDRVPYPVSPDSKYGTSGQLLRSKGNGNTEWSDVGLPTDAQTAQAVNNWLNAHPEATTTVQDGSLTRAKFVDALKYGLLERTYYFKGGTTSELNAICSSGNYDTIIFDGTVELEIGEFLTIPNGMTIIGNGATIKRASGYTHTMLRLRDGVDISGFNVDGGNVTNGTWDTTIELSTGSNCYVHDMYFENANEAIIVYGTNTTVERCKVKDANGNGIHFSGASHCKALNNEIINTNLSESYTNGQCNIYVCDQDYDILIDGNYCENGKYGIGNFNTINNQRITVTNNFVVDSRVLGINGEYYSTEADWSAKDIVIKGNIIKNCTKVSFKNSNNNIKSDMRLVFSDNILIDTKLFIYSNIGAIVSGNRISSQIGLSYCEDIIISNNHSKDISATHCENVLVQSNFIEGGTYGIWFTDDSKRIKVDGNEIVTDGETTNGYCIGTRQHGQIVNNRIKVNGGMGIYGSSNCMIMGNIIIGTVSGVTAIKVYGGESNILAVNNMANENASFSMSTGTNTVYENNLVCTGLQ